MSSSRRLTFVHFLPIISEKKTQKREVDVVRICSTTYQHVILISINNFFFMY